MPAYKFTKDTGGTLTTSLVSYYKLGDTSDFYGANNGTSTSITFGSGKINNSATVGTNGFIDLGSGSSLNISSDITLSAWVYITTSDANAGIIISKASPSANYDQYWLYEQNGTVSIRTRNTSNTVYEASKASAGINQWQHVVGVISGTTMTCYVNGVAGTPTTFSGTRATVSNNACIGGLGWNPWYSMRGTIDEVGIWSKALSTTEISDLYNSGNGNTMYKGAQLSDTSLATDANLKAYYKLENVNDSGSGGKTLTNNGTAIFGDAVYSNGVILNSASSQYLSIADNLGITGGNITMSGWVKITTDVTANGYVFMLQDNSTTKVAYRIWYLYNGGTKKVRFDRGKPGVADEYVESVGALTVGSWYHFALTYNGTTLKGYVNGTLIGSGAASGNGSIDNGNIFRIGIDEATSAGYYANATIDDVAVFDRALTADEIAYLATGAPIVFDAATTGYVNPGTNLTISHTVGTGSNSYVLVGIFDNATGGSVTGVTYNGTSLTKLHDAANYDGSRNYVYGLANPSSGTHDCVISFPNGYVAATVVSYFGVKQSGQPDATGNNTSASSPLTTTVTSVADNDWGFLTIRNAGGGGSVAASTGSTLRGTTTPFSGTFGTFDSGGPKSPAGTISMAVTASGGNLSGTMIAFAPASYALAAGPANLKSWNGLAKASIKSINSLAIGSIKNFNGLT